MLDNLRIIVVIDYFSNFISTTEDNNPTGKDYFARCT